MSITPRFLQDLRDRLTLSEIISRRVKLVRAGREFKGCCPFHREKSPSFTVNDDKQFFHCFGCGAHGDALGFVMRHDNLGFREAVEMLAAQAGMEVPKQSADDTAQQARDKSLYALCEEATRWFEARLYDKRNQEVLDYVTGRGLSHETIAAFRLGFAPHDDQALRTHLNQQGFNDHQMIEAGVLKQSASEGRAPYSFFRDRVIFPVADARGRIVAFGGRILPESLRPPQRSDFKPPKYINSADTPLFHKGRTLYAGQHARMAAKDHPIIVVEGYMDVIACHQAGFKGAVAPLGTALTEEQISLLWKMIPLDEKEPVLCFDGDEAGYRAALRAAERVLPLLKPQQTIKFSFLPEGEDPDTFIRQRGAEGFSQMIAKARPLIEFLWSHQVAGKNFGTPESRAGLSARLETLATHIPDAQLQYHYKQMFREKLRVLFGAGWVNSFKKAKSTSVDLPVTGRQKAESLIPHIMLLTLINHPFLYSYVSNEVQRMHMGHAEWDKLHMGVIDILENNRGEEEDMIDHPTLLQRLKEQGFGEAVTEFLNRPTLYIHAGFARLGTDESAVVEGWKSLWNQWNKSSLSADIQSARRALIKNMSPENEERMMALQRVFDNMNNETA